MRSKRQGTNKSKNQPPHLRKIGFDGLSIYLPLPNTIPLYPLIESGNHIQAMGSEKKRLTLITPAKPPARYPKITHTKNMLRDAIR